MYKERVAKLMGAVKDDSYMLDFIEDSMNKFTDYMGHVAWMETRMQRLRIEEVKGQEYRDAVQAMDAQRRSKHNVAMDTINQLNRLSVSKGLEPFYDGPIDHDHRTEIGDAVGNIVNEYFEGRYVGRLYKKDLMDPQDFAEAVESIKEIGQTEEQ